MTHVIAKHLKFSSDIEEQYQNTIEIQFTKQNGTWLHAILFDTDEIRAISLHSRAATSWPITRSDNMK